MTHASNVRFIRLLPALAVAWMAASSPALAAGPDPATTNGFDIRDALVPARAIERGGPPRDGIPAIDQPKFVPAARAGLAPDARVLGLVRGGVARAYPINILNWHEIVNDRYGDQPVVVTYCPLCGTGMAFLPPSGQTDPRFGVSGLLYNSDVLLYDRATESLWSQILAQAVSGPLKGGRLQPLPTTHTRWAQWLKRHPDTQVLSTETGFSRDYTRDPYAGYAAVPDLMFEVSARDDRLPTKAWVLGLKVGDVAKAYPLEVLAQRVDNQGKLRDSVGGQKVEIRFDREARSAEAFDAAGQPLAGLTAYWFAWYAFHPTTQVLSDP